MAALSGLTGGGGPLNTVSGLTGGGGPLNTVSGLTGGEGGPLNSVTSVAGGLTGGEGGPLDAVSGLAGGLLGGSQGLNVLGLAAIGSDDEAAIDLAPAEKKKEKARKAAIAKSNEDKRKAAFDDLKKKVATQGGPPTAEQQELARQLNASQAADDAQMAKFEKAWGPTDPELYQQAVSGQLDSNDDSGVSQGLFYAYLVDGQSYQPTHMLTFPNATAANQWYLTASRSGVVEKTSDQMFVYTGAAPRPSGRMGYMPINTVQPIIPLQRGDGYPICCKKGSSNSSSTAGRTAANTSGGYGSGTASSTTGGSGSSTTNNYVQPAPAKPPRQKLTFQQAADAHARDAIARGDTRPRDEIVREAMQDLKDNCATANTTCSGQQGNNAPYGNSANSTAGQSSAGGPLGSLTGGGPLNGVTNNLPVGGQGGSLPAGLGGDSGSDPLSGLLGGTGLLGGSQGLNVLGLAAIGSDEDAAIDLAPGEKKKDKIRKQGEINKQRDIQNKQLQALQDQIRQNGGRQTPEQQQQLKELEERRKTLNSVSQKLDNDIKQEEAKEKAQGASGLTNGIPVAGGALPTNNLPVNNLPVDSLPVNNLPVANPLGSL